MKELYHHGINGQKWGVRRYQNPDGSLTDAGKKRYGKTNLHDNYEEGKDYYILRNKKFASTSNVGKKFNLKGRPIYVYDSEDAHDEDVYKGAFAAHRIQSGSGKLYTHTLDTIRDVYVAPVKLQKKKNFLMQLVQMKKPKSNAKKCLMKLANIIYFLQMGLF